MERVIGKHTYDLSTIKSVANFTPTGAFIEMYSEDMGKIIIEFDERGKPKRWNK